jgi:hypothetical protein
MLRRMKRTLAFAALVAALTACGHGEDGSRADSADIVALEPDFIIGQVEGDPDYLFGDIWTVAVDAQGVVYVGDRIGATVRAYGENGVFLGQVARQGGGPGEIQGWPADIHAGADGMVYVRDDARITVFVRSSGSVFADSVAAILTVPGYGNLQSTRGRVSSDGTYWYPNASYSRFFYVPLRNGEFGIDTLRVPDWPALASQRTARYRLGETDSRMVRGLNHVPFARVPVWDVSNEGTVLSTDGDAYAIVETTVRGDTVREIRRGVRGEPIPADERQDSARALQARIDSLPVPIDRVEGLGAGVREGRLPDRLPSIIALSVGAGGEIWVERWPETGGGTRVYDVLDRTGALRSRVVLHAALEHDPPPQFGAKYIAGVLMDPTTGVERVARFTIGNRIDSLERD